LMGASGAAIARAVSGDLVCIARSGDSAPSLGVSENHGYSADCIQTGEPLLCADVESDAWVDRDACRQLGIRSLILVPISDATRVFGILAVFSERAGHFDGSDVDAMRWVALELRPLLAGPDTIQHHPPEQLPDAPPAEVAAEDTVAETAAPLARRRGNAKWWALLSFAVIALAVGWYLETAKRPPSAQPLPNRNSSTAMPDSAGREVAALEAASPAGAAGKASALRPATRDHGFNIRTTSDARSTIVVIETEALASYEIQTLENPDRIYLDLKGVVPAPARRPNILASATDSRLLRIRTARSGNVTRVVLDLKQPVTPTISRRQNPERLIIELQPVAPGGAVEVRDRQ
jgi:AMIN domain/GAF domain